MKRTNWTKKVTILLAAVCLALVGFSAFSRGPAQWLLQVEGVPISREMYCYFLAEALADAETNKQGVPKDMEALREDTKARCTQYMAITSELRNMRVALDQPLKAQAAERSAHLWQAFHSYYKAIGVDKQTVTLAQAGIAARDQLFRALYDKKGPRETPEESILAYFYGNYVAYEGMFVPFTVMEADGNERKMTRTEQNSLISAMNALGKEVNESDMDFLELSGEDIYAKAINYALPTTEIVKKDADMPAEQFERVRGLDPNKLAVLQMDNGVLLGRGVNMREDEEVFYQGYRDASLRALRDADFNAALEELYAAFRTDENVAAVDEVMKGFPWGWKG